MKNFLTLFFLFGFIFTGKIYGDDIYSFTPLNGDTIYYNNFEDGLDDWTPVNLANPGSSTLWHITNSMYVSPGHSAAWNDSAAGSYPHNLNEALVSSPFTIPVNAKVFFNFDVFIHLTPNGTASNDVFDVQISTDGGTAWSFFTAYAYSGQQIGWKSFPADYQNETGELTNYAGKTVLLRFVVSSDNFDPNGNGVFIDNIRITQVECEFTDPFEPNNTMAAAAPILYGSQIEASLCPVGDIDFYSFTASQGDRVNIVSNFPIFQAQIALLNSSGATLATGYTQVHYQINNGGTYFVRITGNTNNPANYVLYVNAINTKPDVMTVTDIPNDQGLQVRVKWQYSYYDPPSGTGQIKEYHLFRKVDDTTSGSRTFLSEEEFFNSGSNNGSSIFIQNEFWDYIATVPAVSNRPFDNYTYTAPTLKDSVMTTFKVAAVNKDASQQVLWGEEGSGYSVDNIAPEFSFHIITPGANEIRIEWFINSAIHYDVTNIKIYRGMFDRFAPGFESMIANLNPGTISFTDNDLISGVTYYYLISAEDNSGNVTITPVVQGGITSVTNSAEVPSAFLLKQNYPNPFNPVTTIEFNLPVDLTISLKVFDLLGNEVAEISKGNYSAGSYSIKFDASRLASGVYFYTLKAGSFADTKKLLLMK